MVMINHGCKRNYIIKTFKKKKTIIDCSNPECLVPYLYLYVITTALGYHYCHRNY